MKVKIKAVLEHVPYPDAEGFCCRNCIFDEIKGCPQPDCGKGYFVLGEIKKVKIKQGDKSK